MKKMSLVFTFVLALVILFSTTTVTNALACPLPINSESSETTYVDLLDRTELLELPRDEQDALDMYRLEVRMRDNHPIMGGEYFVPFVEVEDYEEYGLDYEPEERCVYAEDGYGAFVPWYECPVLFNTGDVKQLWYTDDGGMLCKINLKRNDWRSVKFTFTDYNVHCDLSDGDEIINSNSYFAVTYNETTGSVKIWMFGLLLREHEVPAESIYTGLSTNEGYIFRSGNEVYAVRDYGCYAPEVENGVKLIAQDVKLVIETDYCMGWEECSQPLLLMTDGTVKVYVSGISVDGTDGIVDINDLHEVTKDGGFWE